MSDVAKADGPWVPSRGELVRVHMGQDLVRARFVRADRRKIVVEIEVQDRAGQGTGRFGMARELARDRLLGPAAAPAPAPLHASGVSIPPLHASGVSIPPLHASGVSTAPLHASGVSARAERARAAASAPRRRSREVLLLADDLLGFCAGTVLRALRQGKGVTQRELAAKLSIAQASWCRIEAGDAELSLTRFLEVCTALEGDPIEVLREVLRERRVTRRAPDRVFR